jgi:hypothetical protein
MDPTSIVLLAALIIGLIYGSVGLLSGFCMMSGMRGWLAEGDGRLVRTYALAMGTAIAASQVLASAGLADLGKSIYLQPTFSAPVLFLGGLLFGYGMVMSNGCGSRALVLLGRGNLRSLVVVIILAIFAQMTLKGLIAPSRLAMVGASQMTSATNSLPALLASVGISAVLARMLAASALAAALIIFAFAFAPFRQSPGQIATGVIMGLLVAGGWYATGYLGADDFNPAPVTSLTFIAPIADALQYVMLSTGSTLNFGIVTVFAVFAGSLVTALLTGRFHLEGYQSPRHMLRSAGGAALMGTGGVMAFGCSVGQGLTGLSTLSLASFIAVAGILIGTAAGLRGALKVQPLAA